MAHSRIKPENCTIPECQKCPYEDCIYDKIEKSDREYVQKLNLWVRYQNSCLSGNGNVFEHNNPMVVANEHGLTCNRII